MVLPRVLTALLLVPVMIAVIWLGSLPWFLFVAMVCLFCLWEYSLIAEEGGYPNQLGMSLLGGMLVLFALFLDGVPHGPIRNAPAPFFVFLFWVFLVFVREFFRKDMGVSYLRIITTVSGVVFFSFFLGHLLLIRDLKMAMGEGFVLIGRPLTFFLLFCIWALDTGAWFTGRLMGKFRLAPRISPKKTWEGAVGGTFFCCLVGWFVREAALREAMGPLESIFIAFVVSITAQISDLVESLMKRSFGVKDSSHLLPGHGGFLDRFDSFLFAAPFYYYLLLGTGRFH